MEANAAISLPASIARWVSTRWCRCSNTENSAVAVPSAVREPRTVLPSQASTTRSTARGPAVTWARAAAVRRASTQADSAASTAATSTAHNTRRNVHSDGDAPHKATLCCPSRAHCANAVHDRAPAMIPVSASIRIACRE